MSADVRLLVGEQLREVLIVPIGNASRTA
jgi:hypothetical protein